MVPCEMCGTEAYFTLSRLAKNKHYFCSHRCSSEFRAMEHTERRLCEQCCKEMIVKNLQNKGSVLRDVRRCGKRR